MQEISVPTHCPSFNSYSSNRFAEIANQVTKEFSYDMDQYGLGNDIQVDDEKEQRQSSNKKKKNDNDENNNDEFEFEFAFVSTTSDSSNTPFSIISADQIFSNGLIKPIFPIFNRENDLLNNLNEKQVQESTNRKPPMPPPRQQQSIKSSSSRRLPLGKLFVEEREALSLSSSSSSSSSEAEAEDLESVRARNYCIWSPKSIPSSPEHNPALSKKSFSCGSNKPTRFRLKDLIRRSNSDVNETYVFLAPHLMRSKTNKSKDGKVEKAVEALKDQKKVVSNCTTKNENNKASRDAVKMKPKKKVLESKTSMASSHEIHYLRNRASKEGDRRRSYLPYKKDLIGFFTNVNGLNRKFYPFQAAA